jgi:hypothetical protein
MIIDIFKILTGETGLGFTDSCVRLSNSIRDFLVDIVLEGVKTLISILEVVSVEFAHQSHLRFKFIFQISQVSFKPISECF